MVHKKHIILLLMGIFLFSFVTESYSQRRSSRSTRSSRTQDTEKKEQLPFAEKLSYDLFLGNPYIANTYFEISGKFGVGYKLHDRFVVGVGPKFKYDGQFDRTNFVYGGMGYARFAFSDQFYIKTEYDYLVRKNFDNLTSPLFGIGYLSGFGKWKYGLEVLFPFSSDYRGQFAILDYMFSFIYNM